MTRQLLVLGTGCPKCSKLAAEAEKAARDLGLDYELHKITDIASIAGYGVMMTPALVVDGQVKCVGKVPSLQDLKKLIG
jgi:small redox-active disulfide protein 2